MNNSLAQTKATEQTARFFANSVIRQVETRDMLAIQLVGNVMELFYVGEDGSVKMFATISKFTATWKTNVGQRLFDKIEFSLLEYTRLHVAFQLTERLVEA